MPGTTPPETSQTDFESALGIPAPGNVLSSFFNREQIDGRLQERRADSFIRQEGLQLDPEFELLRVSELEREKLEKVRAVLAHPGLQQLISEGKITAALVKPHVNKGRIGIADHAIAEHILTQEVKPPLQVVFSLATWFTPGEVEKFYQAVMPTLQNIRDGRSTVWERYSTDMTSGAITFALLYSPEGNAFTEWRRQIGPTDPEIDTTGKSIRAKYAFDVRHNAVHGSDSIESVRQEAAWMLGKIDRLLNTQEGGPDDLLQEDKLRECGVLQNDEVFLGVEQFLKDQQVASEGATFAAYIVTLIDERGNIVRRRFVTKDKPASKEGVNKEVERMEKFKNLMPGGKGHTMTPGVFYLGSRSDGRSRIVRQYVPDHTAEMEVIVNNHEWNMETCMSYMRDLIYAAAVIDAHGIASKNLTAAFIFDGNTHVYIGSNQINFDNAKPEPVTYGLADLLAIYGTDEEMNRYIRTEYEAQKKTILAELSAERTLMEP